MPGLPTPVLAYSALPPATVVVPPVVRALEASERPGILTAQTGPRRC